MRTSRSRTRTLSGSDFNAAIRDMKNARRTSRTPEEQKAWRDKQVQDALARIKGRRA